MIQTLEIAREIEQRPKRRRFQSFFPDRGPLRRELYPRHLAFFRLGTRYKTRCAMMANRTGKTEGCGGYEIVGHATGLYPKWWDGYRFDRPTQGWIGGDSFENVRDITQLKLFGPKHAIGTGLIPAECIGRIRWRQHSSGTIDTAEIKHVDELGNFDGWTLMGFKSYDQGRISFQGTEKDWVWLDEEAPPDVRGECVLRLMTTGGLLIETFTPLKGITPTVELYLGEGAEMDEGGVTVREDRALVNAGWDDVPHLDEAEKKRMLAESEPHLKEARSKGIPSMGAGAIYPIPEEDILCDPFKIPPYWPRAYALDVGWNRTAALWGAVDRENDIVYFYREHYRGQAEPVIHAEAIKAGGVWVPGAIDPAARGRSQADGKKLIKTYKDLGLILKEANNEVEAGIYDVWMRLSIGKLKVFRTLSNFRAEYRMYRRNEKGEIIKKNDHLMDDMRYFVRTGMKIAAVEPAGKARHLPGYGVIDQEMGF